MGGRQKYPRSHQKRPQAVPEALAAQVCKACIVVSIESRSVLIAIMHSLCSDLIEDLMTSLFFDRRVYITFDLAKSI